MNEIGPHGNKDKSQALCKGQYNKCKSLDRSRITQV